MRQHREVFFSFEVRKGAAKKGSFKTNAKVSLIFFSEMTEKEERTRRKKRKWIYLRDEEEGGKDRKSRRKKEGGSV